MRVKRGIAVEFGPQSPFKRAPLIRARESSKLFHRGDEPLDVLWPRQAMRTTSSRASRDVSSTACCQGTSGSLQGPHRTPHAAQQKVPAALLDEGTRNQVGTIRIG
jgi:hypothetical protein